MQNKMLGLDWVGRSISAPCKGADVSITVANNNPQRRCINFIFRNDTEKLISETGYIVAAPYKNRVFFKEATSATGITLTKNKNSSGSTYARISSEPDVPKFLDYAGNYQLKYDDFYELYYIEKESM